MPIGINAASQRWTGALVKRDFLHSAEQRNSFAKALSIQYQELSFEHATKAYYWSEHLHDNTEIIFVRKGLYSGALNGHALELKSGQSLIVGPGDLHSDVCRPPLKYYAVRFDIRQVTDGKPIHLLRDKLPPDRYVHTLGNSAILKTLDALVHDEQQTGRFSFPLQQTLAQELLWRLLADLPEDILNPLFVKRTQQSELLVRLTRFFEEHISTHPRVIDMAEGLNMSESTLAHTCTDLLGVSPSKAFARYRMAKASHLLRHSNLSVKEIAAELGFHDESHFIHSFRKEHGTSPGLFRNAGPVTGK
jgi:AraC-like DNA-binding protein